MFSFLVISKTIPLFSQDNLTYLGAPKIGGHHFDFAIYFYFLVWIISVLLHVPSLLFPHVYLSKFLRVYTCQGKSKRITIFKVYICLLFFWCFRGEVSILWSSRLIIPLHHPAHISSVASVILAFIPLPLPYLAFAYVPLTSLTVFGVCITTFHKIYTLIRVYLFLILNEAQWGCVLINYHSLSTLLLIHGVYFHEFLVTLLIRGLISPPK